MRVRQIGSIVFGNNANVVVDTTALDAVGGGFRVVDIDSPQPFSAEIAFIQPTRDLALRALDILARDVYIRSRRRTTPNQVGGAVVLIDDRDGNATLQSLLTNAAITLIAIENSSRGVIARARLTGTLVGPFASTTVASQTFSSLRAYEVRGMTLANVDSTKLAICSFFAEIGGNASLRNAFFIFETQESGTASSRIYRKNPSSVSSNLVLESFNAGGSTTLQRARFTTAGNGSITYTIGDNELPRDTFNLFFEVYLPSVPSSDVFYTINWTGQPPITGVVDFSQSFINAGIYSRPGVYANVTIQINNAPVNTYISPLVFVPVDGVFTYNAKANNLGIISTAYPATESSLPLFASDISAAQIGELRGLPGFVTGKHLTIFTGMMTPTIENLNATVTLFTRHIEPASYM